MPSRLRRHTDNMHIIFNRLLRRLFRRLEHRPHIHIKAQVGKGRGNHLGTAVMTILTHLYHQHSRAAAMVFRKGFDFF